MALSILSLAGGCVLLLYGAQWLVRGASTIASALGIPKSVVGLTLVALGTSAPEMFVNMIAGYSGRTGFALSNVSGSNLTNLCVGFGICGLAGGVVIKWSAFCFDTILMLLAAAVVLAILLLDLAHPSVPLWTIAPLLILLVVYLVSLRRRAMQADADDRVEMSKKRLILNAGLFLLGIAALYGGGEFVLGGAIAIATRLELAPSLIGLTIVAAGTSVPDAMASLVAARRGEHEIAVGNLVGSNISNVLVVLTGTLIASRAGGVSTMEGGEVLAAPGVLLASGNIVLDYAMVCIVSLLFIGLAIFVGRIQRTSGVVLLLTYFAYMGYRVFIEWPT